MSAERKQRYRNALQSDYCGCGACEEQLAAVMAVADAEQAELRSALRARADEWDERSDLLLGARDALHYNERERRLGYEDRAREVRQCAYEVRAMLDGGQ